MGVVIDGATVFMPPEAPYMFCKKKVEKGVSCEQVKYIYVRLIVINIFDGNI